MPRWSKMGIVGTVGIAGLVYAAWSMDWIYRQDDAIGVWVGLSIALWAGLVGREWLIEKK